MAEAGILRQEELTSAIARNIVDIGYEDLLPKTVEATKRDVLDTLGVSLAASTQAPWCQEVVGFVKEGGGKEEASIIAFGGKVPSWMAALVNGALGHSLDYDDIHDDAYVHAGVTTVSAALAVAERVGRVSGKDFITAVTLGLDVGCRLGLAVQRVEPAGVLYGWMLAQLMGYFGATAAAGKLLQLDEDKMVNALGIAYAQAAGNNQCSWGGEANTRGIYGGFAAQSGVVSALLAQRGMTGAKHSFEGREAGLFKVYFRDSYDPEPLIANLGKSFEGDNLSFKPWPCCRSSHRFIEATLGLVLEHDLRADDIEEVVPIVGGYAENLCRPLEMRRNPPTILDAKYSIPYDCAVVISRRKLVMEDFTEEAIRDPAVRHVAQKVCPRFDPNLAEKGGIPPGIVEIRTKGGQTLTKRVEHSYGHPKNPLSTEDLAAKFRDCATYSANHLSEERVSEVLEMLLRLEGVEDVTQIARLLE